MSIDCASMTSAAGPVGVISNRLTRVSGIARVASHTAMPAAAPAAIAAATGTASRRHRGGGASPKLALAGTGAGASPAASFSTKSATDMSAMR